MQIHFVGQGDDLLGAGDDTERTSLAPFGIHLDGTSHFCHIPNYNYSTNFEIGCKDTNKKAKCKEKTSFSLHFRTFSGIIHIFTVECHDVIEHLLRLDGRTLWIKFYRLDIAVDGLVPQTFLPGLVSLKIPLLGGSRL